MLINRNDTLTEVLNNVSNELHRGALDRNHPFRLVSFSTHCKQGVNSRLVVLREVMDDMSLVFFTDSRSNKIIDLGINTNPALLFWHAGKKVQVSVKGHATLHQQDSLAEKYWSNISIEGRKAYGSVNVPGERIERPDIAHNWPSEINNEYFSVLVVRPMEMDVLQLHKLSHYRAEFKRNNDDWLGSWIAP